MRPNVVFFYCYILFLSFHESSEQSEKLLGSTRRVNNLQKVSIGIKNKKKLEEEVTDNWLTGGGRQELHYMIQKTSDSATMLGYKLKGKRGPCHNKLAEFETSLRQLKKIVDSIPRV
uniref:Uncharacterized protein n=1 Tax=Graphocephala atropunctata TaxID=36148 RepID=A0A1B6M5N2_9HEMI